MFLRDGEGSHSRQVDKHKEISPLLCFDIFLGKACVCETNGLKQEAFSISCLVKKHSTGTQVEPIFTCKMLEIV